jgi:trk system potassium uptake protein TrkH
MRTGFRLSTMQVLVIGFALVIIAGGVLLSLPVSSRDGHGIPFLDGLFTATSATCVTGLVVYDTYTQFTFFGQAVILLLIQVGGLGFMFVAILFSLFLGRRIGLRERSILMDSVSALKLGGIVRLTKKALIITVALEVTGAVVLAFRFCPQFGLLPGIWCGLFHSVSAFCNAGFDILGRLEPFSSVTHYSGDPLVSITIMALIVIGGLGFFVWDDITENKHHITRYHLHSKLMLTGTAVLLVGGALLFFFFEAGHSMKDMGFGERVLSSFFASVTPRTAGYNSVPTAQMSEGGTLLTMVLMAIGAGPGSTGGGMKVTTVFIILLGIAARIKNRDDLNVYNRRLEDGALTTASTSAGIYLTLAIIGTFILCAQGFPVTSALYEVLSGIGTVGLTRGITPQLPALSKLTILLLMYAGRVGSLSVAMAMSVRRTKQPANVKNVSEKVIIG